LNFPLSNPVLLSAIRLHSIPKQTTNKDIWFKIRNSSSKYESKGKIVVDRRLAEDYLYFTTNTKQGIVMLDGDVELIFYYGGLFDLNPQKLFACWFNTRFFLTDEEIQTNTINNNNNNNTNNNIIDSSTNRVLTFLKCDLDKACKDTKHKDFSDTFRMDLVCSQI
jgi:hypothetical protein